MTDTGNNRMVKKNKQTKKTLNIKDLRSACLEIFFSLFRPWCEDENLCVFWVWYPSPLVLRPPLLPKIHRSFPWRWIDRSQFDLWSVHHNLPCRYDSYSPQPRLVLKTSYQTFSHKQFETSLLIFQSFSYQFIYSLLLIFHYLFIHSFMCSFIFLLI